ncbi:PAS domain-containing sensor histidine kinase, partial [Azospirillum brasilense]|nr:PAS domain-containing sensor histidine kinase [Azospirillum brasilense]
MASRNPVRDATLPPSGMGPAGMGERLFEILGSVRFLMRASGVAFIVVVNAMIAYGVWQRHTEAVQGAERSTRNLARILEEQAVRTVFSVDLLLSDLVTVLDTHPQARTVAAPSVNALLRNRRDAIGPISGLIVVDEQGRVLHHSADSSPPAFDLTSRPYFAAHRDEGASDGGLHVGVPIPSMAFPGTYVIPMSRRWSHPDGSFAGVVVAMINPLRLGAGFDGLRLGLEGTVTLALADGTVLI